MTHIIDAVVGGLEQTLRGAAVGFAGGPKTAAGQLLLEPLFTRSTLGDEQRAAVTTLEVADRVAKLNLLNDHFGAIPGISVPEPLPPTTSRRTRSTT